MKKMILTVLAVGGLFIGAAGIWVYQTYQQFLQAPMVGAESAFFTLKAGSNIRSVAMQLQQQQLLPDTLLSRWLFILHARRLQQAHKIKAGEYELKPNMRPDEVLGVFVSGQSIQYQLSIVEGKTFKQIVAQIKAHEHLAQTLSEADYANILAVIDSPFAGNNPEGWFYPDTYAFPRNTSDKDFLRRSHKMMYDYLMQAWEQREPSDLISTPYEALILASIVEKETGLPDERAKIAGVFYNRLAKNWLLQTDPTVIYGLGDDYDGNLRKADLKRDTPYNSYTRKGLPPTPIAIPSKAAIDAVMKPMQTDAFYFVATGYGGHTFSRTYREHQRAVADYLRVLRENK